MVNRSRLTSGWWTIGAMPSPRAIRLFESTIPSGNAYKVSLMLSHLGQVVDVVALDIMADPPETRRKAAELRDRVS